MKVSYPTPELGIGQGLKLELKLGLGLRHMPRLKAGILFVLGRVDARMRDELTVIQADCTFEDVQCPGNSCLRSNVRRCFVHRSAITSRRTRCHGVHTRSV